MPPAQELEALERLLTGASGRFMSLTEGEAEHRRRLQRGALWINGVNSTLGVLFGGCIGMIAVGGGVYGMLSGVITDLAGAGVAIGGLASLVAVYFAGRRPPAK
jgi:uncharacterized membrane protein